jgi:hypothetical protein
MAQHMPKQRQRRRSASSVAERLHHCVRAREYKRRVPVVEADQVRWLTLCALDLDDLPGAVRGTHNVAMHVESISNIRLHVNPLPTTETA